MKSKLKPFIIVSKRARYALMSYCSVGFLSTILLQELDINSLLAIKISVITAIFGAILGYFIGRKYDKVKE